MSKRPFTAAGALALLLAGTAHASAHSLEEAHHKLHRIGYTDIEVERASLPYSFTACKRGLRYHVHMNWYGDLEQVDPIGRCRGYAYGDSPRYDGRRSYDEGRALRYRRWREND
jgi:hypothetical protein